MTTTKSTLRDTIIEAIRQFTTVNDGLNFANGEAFYAPFVDGTEDAADAIVAEVNQRQAIRDVWTLLHRPPRELTDDEIVQTCIGQGNKVTIIDMLEAGAIVPFVEEGTYITVNQIGWDK